MPYYTDLPADWQTELEKTTAAKPVVEVIYDPDGDNIPLSGKYDVIDISPIYNIRELDIEWASRPTTFDMMIRFNDPDNYFNSADENSPFHNAIGELYEDYTSGTTVKLRDKEGIAFDVDQFLTISGYDPTSQDTNEEDFYVSSFTAAAGSTYYHTLAIKAALTNDYQEGSVVFSKTVEKKEILIRMRMAGCVSKVTCFRGRILNVPVCESGKAAFVVVELKKFNLDEELTGADTDSTNKLKRIDTTGALADSVYWNSGSSGTLDRTKVFPLSGCRLGKWTATFSSNTSYTLEGPEEIGLAMDTRYGLVSHIDNDDDANILSTYGIVKGENTAYIADDGTHKLLCIDISDPTAPSVTGSAAVTGVMWLANGVATFENYVFLLTNVTNNAIQSFDVTDPANPAFSDEVTDGDLGTTFIPYCIAIDASGDYAFVGSTGDDQLYVFDISDPTAMAYETKIGGAGSPNYMDNPVCIDVSGDYAYVVTTADKRLVILDVSDPTSPSLVSTYDPSGGALYGVYVSDDSAFIADTGKDTVYYVDITDKNNPILTATISGAGRPNYLSKPWVITGEGDYLYVGCTGDDHSLVILDRSGNNLTLAEAIRGTGEPNFLRNQYGIVYESGYIYISGGLDCFSIYRVNETTGVTGCFKTDQLVIYAGAWGGTRADGDTVSFATAISWSDENVIQVLYDLYVTHAGIDNKLLQCSSYFDDIDIGTLYENADAGDTTIKVAVSVPTLIKTGETLTLTDGATTEDVTVATGVATTSQYPPYIDLTVGALSNSYTPATIVTWKQRTALDTDFSWDAEYNFCDQQGYNISISFDREMTILQAIEEVSKHGENFTFSDNWGVEKIHTFRPHYNASVSTFSKSTNLALPNPQVEAREMVNEIRVQYGYDYANSEFMYEVVYPETTDDNRAYTRFDFIRSKTIHVPGVWTEAYAKQLAKHKYFMWENGLRLIRFRTTLQGLVVTIGDHLNIDSDYPEVDTEVEVIGVSGIRLLSRYEFEFLAYDSKFLWNNYFLVNSSGIATGKVLW